MPPGGAAAGKGFFDIHCYHEHGTFEDYALLVDSRFLPLRRETGTTVPWFSNETSITSAAGSEKRQAVTLFKKLVFAWSRGAIGYSWYDLRNDGFSPTDWEHNFGMTTYDFQPKFVYGVYNTLASVLGDARFVRDWSRAGSASSPAGTATTMRNKNSFQSAARPPGPLWST